MSKVPTTPPEISSRADTSPDSLLARLRKITGLTDAELPPPPPPEEDPAHQAAPVEKLIVALREMTGVLSACGIAVAAALAVVALWLWERTLEGRLYARRWQQRRMQARAEKQSAAEVPGALASPVSQSRLCPVPGEVIQEPAPASEPHIEKEVAVAEPVAVESDVSDPSDRSGEPAAVPQAAPRRRRPVLLSAAALVLLSPALLLVPAVRYYFTGLLGWGNAVVVVGEDGWLFPRTAGSPALPALRDTAAALRAHGATLVVVSIPSKSAVYPEKLNASAGSGIQRNPGIHAAHKELTDAGALVLDPGPALHALKSGDAVFRPQSSHWSPCAVEKAAAETAAFLQTQAGYASLPLRPLPVEIARVTVAAPADDLAAAFDSRRYREAHPPQPLHFIRLLNAEKKPLASDPAAPVVLLGGDDVRLYDDPALTATPDGIPSGEPLSGGFAQYLAMYLSAPLEVQTAASSLVAAKSWLATRPEAERKSKRFILWLISDDELLH